MRLLIATLCLTLTLTLTAQNALACACCAEKGERFTQVDTLDAYAQGELAALVSAGPVQSFVTACDLECLRGVQNPQYNYEGTLSLQNGIAHLDLGLAGELDLPLGESLTRFAVDPTPFAEGPVASLYSEFRFVGPLIASDDFQAATGANAELILVGQTNWCWSAADLTHWILDVSGPEVEFRLFGQFQP